MNGMNNVRVVLNKKGVRELLQSKEITSVVSEACEGVAKRAGTGYAFNTQTGKNRAVGRVYAVNKKAISDNYKNNTLLKALK